MRKCSELGSLVHDDLRFPQQEHAHKHSVNGVLIVAARIAGSSIHHANRERQEQKNANTAESAFVKTAILNIR